MVSGIVLLDAGPLGMLTNPNRTPATDACTSWLQALIASDIRVIVPEIADYEIRRELLRANKSKGLAHLDNLCGQLEYLPLDTAAMRQAARFWAQARQRGQPTASDRTIDADMILAGQAMGFGQSKIVVATTNVEHLSRFVSAELWTQINAV